MTPNIYSSLVNALYAQLNPMNEASFKWGFITLWWYALFSKSDSSIFVYVCIWHYIFKPYNS